MSDLHVMKERFNSKGLMGPFELFETQDSFSTHGVEGQRSNENLIDP